MRLREEPDASSGIGAQAQAIFDRLIEELLDIVPEWLGVVSLSVRGALGRRAPEGVHVRRRLRLHRRRADRGSYRRTANRQRPGGAPAGDNL